MFELVKPVQVKLKLSLDTSNMVTDVNYKDSYVINIQQLGLKVQMCLNTCLSMPASLQEQFCF